MTDFTNKAHQGASPLARVTRWWRSQNTARQKQLMGRGGLTAACFGMVVVGMPILSDVNSDRQIAEEFRDRSIQLASAADAGETVRADQRASALLQHEWLRTVEYSLERNPENALDRFASMERDRAAISSLTEIEVPRRVDAENMLAQTQCLATAIYYEARSERTSGQLGVAEVIMNRVKDHRYPNTVCDVVYQGATRTTGCQFTFTCDGALNRKPYGSRWDKAQTIAAHVVMGLNEKKTGGATHYHATYVNPVWNSGLIKTEKIGTHIFYRFPRGSEWSVATARQNRRLAQRRTGMRAIAPAAAGAESKTKVLTTVATETDLNSASLSALKTAAPASGAGTQ